MKNESLDFATEEKQKPINNIQATVSSYEINTTCYKSVYFWVKIDCFFVVFFVLMSQFSDSFWR